MNQNLTKAVSRKLKYYMEVKRLEDGFDLSYNNNDNIYNYNNNTIKGGRTPFYHGEPMLIRGTPSDVEKEEEVRGRIACVRMHGVRVFGSGSSTSWLCQPLFNRWVGYRVIFLSC